MIGYQEFSSKIKAKYPEYANVPDDVLAKKMVEKYPDYANQVSFDNTIDQGKKEFNSKSALERFALGVGAKAYENYLTAKNVFTDVSPEEKARVSYYKQASEGDVPSGAGEIANEASLLIAPGMGFANSLGRMGMTGLKKLMGVGALEGAASAGLHQAQNNAVGRDVSGIDASKEIAVSTAFPFLFGATKYAAKPLSMVGETVADVIKTSSDLDKAFKTSKPYTTKQGFRLTPGQVNPSPITKSIELSVQANPFLADIPEEIAQANRIRFSDLVDKQVKRVPKSTGQAAVPSAIGAGLEESLRTAKTKVTNQLSDFNEKNIAGNSMEFSGQFGIKEDISRVLNSKVEGPKGTERISDQAISYLNKKIEQSEGLTKPIDILRFKQKMADETGKFDTMGVPLFGEKDKIAFDEVYKSLNKRLEDTFDALPDGGKIKDLWKETNKRYAVSRGALENIGDRLGVGKSSVAEESYMKKIESMGAQSLNEIKQISEQVPDMKPVFENMQGAFFDNFLLRSTSKNGMEISVDKLITNWGKMDDGVKSAMLPKKVVSDLDQIVATMNKMKSTDIYAANPSGTAYVQSMSSMFKDPKEYILSKILRGPVKDYYEKGNTESLKTFLSLASTSNNLMEEASKIVEKEIIKQGIKGIKLANKAFLRQAIRTTQQ